MLASTVEPTNAVQQKNPRKTKQLLIDYSFDEPIHAGGRSITAQSTNRHKSGLEPSRPFSLKVANLENPVNQALGQNRRQAKRAGRSDWTFCRIRSWRRAMIRQKRTAPSLYLSTPSPEPTPSPRSSLTISGWDADDEETMSTEDLLSSQPPTEIDPDLYTKDTDLYHIPSRPTLAEVLSNSAPAPWTLSAFTAYLSQNHCLENLEFTMDAERYRDRYDEMLAHSAGTPIRPDYEECRYLRMLWRRLMDAYIFIEGARAINIPSSVRGALLSLPNDLIPPPAQTLETAVKIVFDLMEQSVLVSFLADTPQSYPERRAEGGESLKRRLSSKDRKAKRSRSRRRASPSSSKLDLPFSLHTGSISHHSTSSHITTSFGRGTRAPSHLSSGSGDAGLTDDSTSASSPTGEPMTPPTTPPSSDVGGSSPRGRTENTWKKMLGWKKKSSSVMRDQRFPTSDD